MNKIRNLIVFILGGGLFVFFHYLDRIGSLASYKEYFYWIPIFIFVMYLGKKITDAENEFGLMEMRLEDLDADNEELIKANETYARRIAQLEKGAQRPSEANGDDYQAAINTAYEVIYEKRYGDAHYTRLALTEIASGPNEAIGALATLSYLNGVSDMATMAVGIANNFTRQRKNTLNIPQQIAALIYTTSEQLLPPVQFGAQKV